MTKLELWFHRAFIILLFLFVILLAKGVTQAHEMALKNVELISINTDQITDILELMLELTKEK